MATASIKVESKAVRQRIDRMLRSVDGTLRRAMLKQVTGFERRFRRRRLSGKSADSLGRRTGTLSRSLVSRVEGTGIETRGVVEFQVPRDYRPVPFVHEFGATISAKNSPFLHFPIRRGAFGAIETWVKTKRVKIPARLNFRKDWKAASPKMAEGLFADVGRQLLKEWRS